MDVPTKRFGEDFSATRERQRARGEIRVAFARVGARTEAARVYETGGLRARFPRSGAECEAVIVNTGGGMAGGDRACVHLTLARGARAVATTQAAEKIYRADGAGVGITTRLEVDSDCALVWAPQETLLFEGSRLTRRLEADVAADGSLLVVEALVFGRLAHGETRIDGSIRDDWRIRRGGNLLFAEALRIDDAGATLDRPAVGRGARAVATLAFVDPIAPSRLEDVRAALDAVASEDGEWLEAGASAFDGMLVARALSPAPQRLRAALLAAMRAIRGREAPRVWS
jgi:urease accessory protein